MRLARKILAVLAGLTLAAWLAFVCRESLLRTAGNLLVVRDQLEHSDLIFMLDGHYDVRAPAAARLFKEGWAPLIVFAREPDSDRPGVASFSNTTASILKADGVPEDRIIEVPFGDGAKSTADEARALRLYVNSHRVRRIVLLTSWYHCRRALLAVSRSLQGTEVELLMFPVREPDFNARNWWCTTKGRRLVVTEYVKNVYYFLTFFGSRD